MGSRRGVALAGAEVAAIAASLVASNPHGATLELVGRVAAAVISRRNLAIDPSTTPIPLDVAPADLSDAALVPEIVGLVYEQLLAVDDRRQRGAHFTPPKLAERLVSAATTGWSNGLDAAVETGPGSVVDPSCGGGVFVLAGARWMVEHGCAPGDAVERIAGIDVCADAVAVSQLALAMWFAGQRGTDEAVSVDQVGHFTVGDALTTRWPSAALVVGNPPFLSQLSTPTAYAADTRVELRERFGEALRPYTDPAWLFLLAAVEATAAGGRVMLIQPTSLLSARDGAVIRQQMVTSCDLIGLWLANERVFGAAVDVWAPVLERRPASLARQPPPAQLWVGADVESIPSPVASTVPSGPEQWTSLCADIVGVPPITWPRSETRIGDVATVTAGFRDQFYGFVPYTAERAGAAPDPGAFPRLVTVGMIDPLRLRWGTRSFRFAGAALVEPVVDRTALTTGDPGLGAWLDQRLRPKLLVATQTKVLEVVVDTDGSLVPATPCLSIEPFDDDPAILWTLAAALTSPALTVIAKRESMGAALSADAIKISAQAVAALPMPSASSAALAAGIASAKVAAGASSASQWTEALDALAVAMNEAYGVGVESDALQGWWRQRRPAWR